MLPPYQPELSWATAKAFCCQPAKISKLYALASGLESLGERLLAKKQEAKQRNSETVWEAYLRRKREKKALRKRQGKQHAGSSSDDDTSEDAGSGPDSDMYDAAGPDPFFQQDDDPFKDPFFQVRTTLGFGQPSAHWNVKFTLYMIDNVLQRV